MARSNPFLVLAALLPLLVASPLARAAQPIPAAPPAATVATPTNAPAAITTPQPDTAPPATAAGAKPLPATMPGGYRLRNIKGEMAYCRSVVPIGTTIAKQECYTPEALAELQKLGQRQSDGIMQHMAICGASTAACVAN